MMFFPGHYMYIEASAPRRKGDTAQLITPSYSSATGACLKFWYSMKGTQMGTLDIIQSPSSGAATSIFTKTGNQGLTWQLAEIVVPPSANYTLTFEATVGGFSSDIAIDDVSVNTGICTRPGIILWWKNIKHDDRIIAELALLKILAFLQTNKHN